MFNLESLHNVFLTKAKDRERRTLAQEQGIVLTPNEFLTSLTSDLPHSVQDVLNGTRANRVQARTWLRVPRPVTKGSKP